MNYRTSKVNISYDELPKHKYPKETRCSDKVEEKIDALSHDTVKTEM